MRVSGVTLFLMIAGRFLPVTVGMVQYGGIQDFDGIAVEDRDDGTSNLRKGRCCDE